MRGGMEGISESSHSYKVTGDHFEKAHSLGSCPLHKKLRLFYFSSVAPGEARLHHQCIKLIIQNGVSPLADLPTTAFVFNLYSQQKK